MIEDVRSKFDKSESKKFWDKIERTELTTIVELDPPKTADIDSFMIAAEKIKSFGADMITIADSPSAVPRVDAGILASRIKRELGGAVLPHITCRDRNSVALKSLVMGLEVEGIDNILLVTGDPSIEESTGKYKNVFEYNSVEAAKVVKAMEANEISETRIFGALNVNAVNFDAELEKAKNKIDAGMCGLLTQPAFTKEAMSNIIRAGSELGCFIFGGIMPITSPKNAMFMEENVPGITVGSEIISMYEAAAGKDEWNRLAVDLSLKTADVIKDYVDGFYIMTPFLRTDLVGEIIDGIKE